jgi:hypothetical protein
MVSGACEMFAVVVPAPGAAVAKRSNLPTFAPARV